MVSSEIVRIVKKILNRPVRSVRLLGSGFYAAVFEAVLPDPPERVAVKLYRAGALAQSEADTLQIMRAAGLPVPRVYGVVETSRVHALCLQSLGGVNAAEIKRMNAADRDRLGDAIVDALIAQHALTHDGYGDVGGDAYYARWHDFYYRKCLDQLQNIDAAHTLQLLDHDFYRVIVTALARFDEIFDLEPERPALIHGDFNTANLLVDRKSASLVGVIDPMGAMWGDPDYELFQLKEGNGDLFGLFDKYARRRPLGEKFAIKDAFYKTFAETNHYARLRMQQDEHLTAFGRQLAQRLKRL